MGIKKFVTARKRPPLITSDKPKKQLGRPPQASTTARGYGAVHKKLRLQRIEEHPVCELCNSAWSCEGHHVHGVLAIPEHELTVDDYQALCRRCHSDLEWSKRNGGK
jgi:hypothetical protein